MKAESTTRLAILGAGQLAWMLGREAKLWGWNVRLVGGKPGDPATAIADEHIQDDQLKNADHKRDALSDCDMVTFESEFADFKLWEPVLVDVATKATKVFPPVKTMQLLSDKWEQKLLFKKHNLPTAHAELYTRDECPERSAVLKWARQGYDGYGNLFLPEQKADWKEFAKKAQAQNARIYMEEKVVFDLECACLMARDAKGVFFRYPAFITQQKNGICEWVYGPAENFFPEVQSELGNLTPQLESFMNELNYVGIMAFEFFFAQGKLVLNEVAPRVHNSGHVTLDAFNVNQFQIHLLASQGFIDDQFELDPVVFGMKNILGKAVETPRILDRQANDFTHKSFHTYWYGKKELKPGRKLGHINGIFESGSSIDKIKECLNLAEVESLSRIMNP